ncbi:hypothetical protein Drose_38000 [Dactylosporangium roseum]|uniref:Uncharacterized protein n=1 Tax=Dactylosporangium roseum TaxID=47989 RepID=A0ABY5Z6M9_9ACTN|nr:hypothetical protein [Dactylosporangium roseum]UWZ36718.1 hypothetical protein Drose_38000 [Dactylosporangium roseum]
MTSAVPASAPRVRPSTVSLAVNLLYAAAALELIYVILGAVYAGKLAEGAKRAVEGTSQANAGQGVSSVVSIVVGLVIAVLLGLLAFFVGQGKQVARILTWVVGGLALCCTIGAFGFAMLGSTFWEQARKNDPSLPTWERYNELLYSEVPGWYQPVTMVLSVLTVIAILVAIILLALPKSHPYFRTVQQEWEPPVPPTS